MDPGLEYRVNALTQTGYYLEGYLESYRGEHPGNRAGLGRRKFTHFVPPQRCVSTALSCSIHDLVGPVWDPAPNRSKSKQRKGRKEQQ